MAKERDYDGICVMTEVPSQTPAWKPGGGFGNIADFCKIA